MNTSWKKAVSVLATAGVMASLLVGCASSGDDKKADEGTATQTTGGKAKLTVWSHWGDAELEALKSVAQEWATKTGNEVNVQIDNDKEFQNYSTAARSGKGPDILFGLPHDNLGTFAKAGLLAELPSGEVNQADYVPVAFQGTTVDGKVIAMPISMETYGLYYNTDKVKSVPTTWADFVASAQQNGFMYDINNFYFTYPFIQGYGGYVFKNNAGTYDTNDIGLGNEGAKKGYQLIADMVNKYKFMPADVNGDIAKGKFTSKSTAYYISGPWDVEAVKKAGVNFDIAPLPTLENGQKPKTLVGIQTGIVSTKSQHQKEAWDLLKYISENGSKKFLEAGARIPVVKSQLEDASFKNNKTAVAFANIAANGEPMPNIPSMAAVWTPEGNNLKLITSGKSAPDKAAGDILSQIKEGIATQQ
ncbi:maltose ABC transporter substrate-binding protein [Tumebacillus sp. ITR2]|uniref:Maltodextrin-binding protein n=1 Tax=Tumebacillus amylolyticus TaxID=2801339 RepID=A0ABS1JGF9_9BACL|nr:maltose ABC transporter substrate-binding protein [Tumebacillus amylolyticus]MBL0389354.1 maltose ABC transporter substrate-binding protein [Tumebacillus amylolyticus]